MRCEPDFHCVKNNGKGHKSLFREFEGRGQDEVKGINQAITTGAWRGHDFLPSDLVNAEHIRCVPIYFSRLRKDKIWSNGK